MSLKTNTERAYKKPIAKTVENGKDKERSSNLTLCHVAVAGVISLILGLSVYSLWSSVHVIAGGLSPGTYKTCGIMAGVGIFLAMAKAGLGLAPTYNRPRILMFVLALVAFLINMIEHPSAGNIVERSAQLFLTLYIIYAVRPPHEGFHPSLSKWAWGLLGIAKAALFGWVVSIMIPDAVFPGGWWWEAISLTAGLIVYIAVMIQVGGVVKSDSLIFIGIYGLGNAAMVLSYLGSGEYNGAGIFLNSALSALLIGKLSVKFCRWKARAIPKLEQIKAQRQYRMA